MVLKPARWRDGRAIVEGRDQVWDEDTPGFGTRYFTRISCGC
jgi:hypothetical protein